MPQLTPADIEFNIFAQFTQDTLLTLDDIRHFDGWSKIEFAKLLSVLREVPAGDTITVAVKPYHLLALYFIAKSQHMHSDRKDEPSSRVVVEAGQYADPRTTGMKVVAVHKDLIPRREEKRMVNDFLRMIISNLVTLKERYCDSFIVYIDGLSEVRASEEDPLGALYIRERIVYWKFPRQVTNNSPTHTLLKKFIDDLSESALPHFASLSIRGNWTEKKMLPIVRRQLQTDGSAPIGTAPYTSNLLGELISQQRNNSLQASNDRKDQEIQGLRVSIDIKEREIQRLRDRIARKDESIQQLEGCGDSNLLRAVNRYVNTLLDDLEKAKAEVDRMERVVSEKSDELGWAQSCIRERDSSIATMRRELVDLRGRRY